MKTLLIDQSQQANSNPPSSQNNLVSFPEKSKIEIQENEEEVETSYQRRPQFRFNENNRRRFL